VRELVPSAWLLVPGVGAQGGDLEATVRGGFVPYSEADGVGGGLLINASRSLLYASSGPDFADAAGTAAAQLARQMAELLPL
jgi:orotidine-5'-phosphate decarboxylase